MVWLDEILSFWLSTLNPQPSTLNFELSIFHFPSSYLKSPLFKINSPSSNLLSPSAVNRMWKFDQNCPQNTGIYNKFCLHRLQLFPGLGLEVHFLALDRPTYQTWVSKPTTLQKLAVGGGLVVKKHYSLRRVHEPNLLSGIFLLFKNDLIAPKHEKKLKNKNIITPPPLTPPQLPQNS